MFIRVKRRKVRDAVHRWLGKVPDDVDLIAMDFVVVESVRTAHGPRQRVVKYIGSIWERFLGKPNVAWFYRDSVEPALQAVAATAKPGTYEKLLAQMHALVPPVASAHHPEMERIANEIRALQSCRSPS